MGSVLTFQGEKVTGFFFAGGLRKGSVVYVTNNRIRVNKRKVQHLLKTDLFVTSLLLIAGLGAPWLALLLFFPLFPLVVLSRLYERRKSRRIWPSIRQIERGRRRFEVRREQLLGIELKAPRILRHGYAKFMPLVGEPIAVSIARNKNFVGARSVLLAFDPARVTLAE